VFRLKSFERLCLSLLSVFLPALATGETAVKPADTILVHAHIYTVDTKHPWAEALAIRDGRLIAVGSNREIRTYLGPSTQAIDAKGGMVLPGFTDCHVHFMDGSTDLQEVNLEDVKSIAEVQKKIKEYAAAHPDEPWVLGRGWAYQLFPPNGLPDKKYLDEVVRDRPAYMESFDGHSWWANSKALAAAKIGKDTPDPKGGSFVRDPATGDPTGAVTEDAADALIRKTIPLASRETRLQLLRGGIKLANQSGLVRVHVLGGVNAGRDDLQNVDLLEELRRAGELTLRFYLAYRLDPPEVTEKQLKEAVAAKERYHDDWIAAGGAKIFLDGVIETNTAAMLAPYSNNPAMSGDLLWEPAAYKRYVSELDKRGIQVFTHAIGDRAIRLALDAYENAAESNGTTDLRHRIEHIEDPAAADIPRFGKLGVIASMQPLHAYPDEDTLGIWSVNVGPERAQRGWPLQSIQKAGGVLAFGSDWPIVTLSPWPGLQNAVTRQTTDGKPAGGWLPSERVTLADALKGYTLNAAFAGHREKDEGSLEVGKLADFIVISQDIFKVAPSKISDTQVLLTVVGGRVAYKSESFR
jgi:predicted amidohydrolase YtcJ